MKEIKFLVLMLLSFSLSVAVVADSDFDSIAGGSDEFSYIKNQGELLLKIQRDVELVCKEGLCTLFAVDTDHNDFSIEFNVGYGDDNGYYGNGTGSVVVLPGNGSTSSSNSDEKLPVTIGFKAKYSVGNCTQQVKVPETLYMSMNVFLAGLLNNDGTPRKGFTPADEAMIMFYTTIMKQANGCK